MPRTEEFAAEVMQRLPASIDRRTGRAAGIGWAAAAAMLILGIVVRGHRLESERGEVSSPVRPSLFSPYMVSDRPDPNPVRWRVASLEAPRAEFNDVRFLRSETLPPVLEQGERIRPGSSAPSDPTGWQLWENKRSLRAIQRELADER